MERVVDYQSFLDRRLNKINEEYICYVSLERLAGHCELLICELDLQNAEWFHLSFTPEGKWRMSQMKYKANIEKWIASGNYQRITYLQAMRLLGDSIRQYYKYNSSEDWIESCNSIHMDRIWDEEYYNDWSSELHWSLPMQEFEKLLATYLHALRNKDAVLVYDLSAREVQQQERRSMYAHHWGHELEDFRVIGGRIDKDNVTHNGIDDYTLYLTLYGSSKDTQLMEVDLRLRIIKEDGMFRILEELVLEARII